MSVQHRSRAWFFSRLSVTLVALVVGPFGCHSLRLFPPLADKPEKTDKDQQIPIPSKHFLRVSQYAFYSEFALKGDLPIFKELADLRDQVYKELQLPDASTTVVKVYLFEDRTRYEKFMKSKYPDLPKRRAFFVAQPRGVGSPEDLLVYTFWGDRIQQDLRHELTHALLHSVLKDVPLWLDEGLAEYFELPPDWKGVNFQHVGHLRRGTGEPFKPDLNRLEQLSQVQQMTPAEYRESWAWVHLMLHDKPEARSALLSYLQLLRTNPNPGALQPSLAAVYTSPEDSLQKHLAKLDATPPPQPSAQR